MRVSEALLRLAARRWPADIRAEMLHAWHAELHVLARQGKRLAMLGFAASLVFSRPDREPAVVIARSRSGGFLALLGGPAAGIATFAACAALGSVLFDSGDLLVFTAAALVAAGLMARLGYRWGAGSNLGGPALTVLATCLTLPIVPYAVSVAAGLGSDYIMPLMAWWPWTFLALLLGALFAARRRMRAAWLAGGVGLLVPIGLACALDAYLAEVPLREALTGPPQVLLVLSAYSLSYVVSAASCPVPRLVEQEP